jgi:CHAT domain-containing protein
VGDYAQAERSLLEARSIREKVLGREHPGYAVTLNNLGLLYQDMGDYAQAERCHLEARSIREKVLGREHPGYAGTLNSLGTLYYTMGDYVQAERCFLEVKVIAEKALGREHPSYAVALNNLGGLYHAIGDYAQAERYLLEAKVIREKVLGREHPDYATTLSNLGVLYSALGDYAQAERCHLEAGSIQEKALGREHPDYATTLSNMSFLYQDMGAYARATELKAEVSRLRIGMADRNFAFLSGRQRASYWDTMAFDFEGSYSLSYFYPAAASNGLNYNNTLFSKGLLLRTSNAVRDSVYSSGDTALIGRYEELGRLRQQISALRQSGGDRDYIQSLETRAEELDKSLTRDSAAYRDLRAGLALTWQDVRDSLKKGEAAVEFAAFRVYDKKWTPRTAYAALLVNPGREAPVWIPLCDEERLKELFAKVQDQQSPLVQTWTLYDQNGAELYAAVWQPLEKELKGVKTLYYAPAGLLHKLAFGAVPVPGKKEVRLADVYDLNLVSSTAEAVRRERGSGAAGPAVIYGGLEYDGSEGVLREASGRYRKRDGAGQRTLPDGGAWGGVGFLKGTAAETEGIAARLGRRKIPNTLYSGSLGNEESFKALDGAKTAVLHLATHGFFLEDVERNYEEQELVRQLGGEKAFENPLLRSGLILAGANHALNGKPLEGIEDGILTADEVSQLNLTGTALVVLSACQTGLGEVNNGEGVFGLQRAFKLAGVETLIMSLWSVDDYATALLMEVFYEQWLSGKSKQAAFKEARRQVRKKYPQPFYWAAFVMMD